MDPVTAAIVASILGIIDKILQLQLALPIAVRTEQAEELQADVNWWRTLLGLYVPQVAVVVPVVPKPASP